MPDTRHLSTKELAARWQMSVGHLANWRSSGGGPRYIKFGRRVLYPLAEVEAYERKNLQGAVHVKVEKE